MFGLTVFSLEKEELSNLSQHVSPVIILSRKELPHLQNVQALMYRNRFALVSFPVLKFSYNQSVGELFCELIQC